MKQEKELNKCTKILLRPCKSCVGDLEKSEAKLPCYPITFVHTKVRTLCPFCIH